MTAVSVEGRFWREMAKSELLRRSEEDLQKIHEIILFFVDKVSILWYNFVMMGKKVFS